MRVSRLQIIVVRDTLTAPQRFLYTPRWIVWVLVTAAMFPACIWLWSALLHLLLGPPNLWGFPEQTSLARILLCGLGSGALVGAVQWPLIRPYGISAGKWLAGSTVGWTLGMLVWGGLVSFMASVDRQFR